MIQGMLIDFGTIYSFLYDYETCIMNFSSLVKKGDQAIEKDPDTFKKFVALRGDLLTSDREVAAYGVVYEKYKGEKSNG